jgi:hypothetical protein
MKSDKIYQILFMTFFGMFGSILIGFIFLNTSIFIFTSSNSQLVTVGLYGSLFFSLLEYKNIKEQIFGMVIILISQLVIFTGKSLSISFIIRDVIYLGSIFISIKLYHQFIKRNKKIKLYLRSFALVLFLGLTYTISIIIVFLINANSGFPPFGLIFSIARIGILIGLGIGLGLDFYLQNEKHLFNLLKIKIA